jgi:K+-transporting ATPase ATPase C chain
MRRQLLPALRMTIALIVLLGLVYPLVMTGVAQALFPGRANGSLIKKGGTVIGSSLIGQSFLDAQGNPDPKYFQSRPSAAGSGYDATASGASNLGPSNPALISTVAERVVAYRTFNNLPANAPVPVDAVTSSGSGLDPDISVANADDQAPRVATTRHLPLSTVMDLVKANTQGRPAGIFGEATVNVLNLNLALNATH